MKHLILIFSILLISLFSNAQQITDIPTIYIRTDNGLPISSKTDYVHGSMDIMSLNATEVMSDVPLQIRGRGNSTWGMPKKPYRIKLDTKASLLNQKAVAKDWVLLANYSDKTLIRNGVANEISQLLGLAFTPCTRYVDVCINGEYMGNYILTDQIEVHKSRVAIEKQEITDTTLPNISGGYLMEIDGFYSSEPLWIKTSRGLPVTLKYPDDDKINEQQKAYITQYMQQYEDVLFSDNYTDAENGYRALVDTTSLINWYIYCELSANPDCFWSTYIYKQRNDNHLYYGPIWDNDIAFNNDERMGNTIYKLMREVAYENEMSRNYVSRYYSDSWFVKAVNRRWQEMINDGLEEKLDKYIVATAQLLQQSQKANFEKWSILSSKVYLETHFFSTYEEYIEDLREYVKTRIRFLTNSFAGNFVAQSYYYSITNVNSGLSWDVVNQSNAENEFLELWTANNTHHTQLWQIVEAQDGYFQILNKISGFAVCGNDLGEMLTQVLPDVSDDRQLWKITPVGDGTIYGIVNKATNFSINNSRGGTTDGTALIVYNNRIAESLNQQWRIVPKEEIIDSTIIFGDEKSQGLLQSGKAYRIRNIRSGKYATAMDYQTNLLQQALDETNDAQIFYLNGNNQTGYALSGKELYGYVLPVAGAQYVAPYLDENATEKDSHVWYIDYTFSNSGCYGIFARYYPATDAKLYWNDYGGNGRPDIGFYSYDEGSKWAFEEVTTEASISISSDPEGAGILNGGGTYEKNSLVTVTAMPLQGYRFDSWTDNGQVVSNSLVYKFVVQNNRELVAHFTLIDTEFINETESCKVYYNALQQEITWLTSEGETTVSTASIYSENGMQMLQANEVNRMDISMLNRGVYFLRWTVDGKSHMYRFMKQ